MLIDLVQPFVGASYTSIRMLEKVGRKSVTRSAGTLTPSRAFVGLVTVAALLTACGADADSPEDADSPGDTNSPGDEAPDAGAFADMEETTLTIQTASPPGTSVSDAYEAWAEAVEEKSDGKLKFEINYGVALVPFGEVEEGLASGLLDIANHAPAFSPAQFPVDGRIQQLNSIPAATPLGILQGIGAQNEFGLEGPFKDELVGQGLMPLLAPLLVVSEQLVCGSAPVTSLAEASGTSVRVPGEVHAAEVEALGMVPTATTTDEQYEAMQRGIVECSVMSPQDVVDRGIIDVIEHWTLDPDVSFSAYSSLHMSMSKVAWDDLPVEAQRLLWDTAGSVYLPSVVSASLIDNAAAIAEAADRGIELHEWADDAQNALSAHQTETVEMVAQEHQQLVDDFTAVHEDWLATLLDLGYGETMDQSWADFAKSGAAESLDLGEFISAVQEVRVSARP